MPPSRRGLLVVLWWKRGRLSWKGDVAAAAALLRWRRLPRGLCDRLGWRSEVFGAGGRTSSNCSSIGPLPRCRPLPSGFTLGKLFWPADARPSCIPAGRSIQAVWWQYLYPGGGPLAAGGALVDPAPRPRAAGSTALLFAGTLFPALGFFNAYSFRYSFVNDHHQYLASLGMIALASAGAGAGSWAAGACGGSRRATRCAWCSCWRSWRP